MSLYCYEDQVVKYNFHIIVFRLVMLSSRHISSYLCLFLSDMSSVLLDLLTIGFHSQFFSS